MEPSSSTSSSSSGFIGMFYGVSEFKMLFIYLLLFFIYLFIYHTCIDGVTIEVGLNYNKNV